jgi:hypothetical protein
MKALSHPITRTCCTFSGREVTKVNLSTVGSDRRHPGLTTNASMTVDRRTPNANEAHTIDNRPSTVLCVLRSRRRTKVTPSVIKWVTITMIPTNATKNLMHPHDFPRGLRHGVAIRIPPPVVVDRHDGAVIRCINEREGAVRKRDPSTPTALRRWLRHNT